MWYVDYEGGDKLKNSLKKPVFRLCNDSVFKEIFSKVPNALIVFISDILGIKKEKVPEPDKEEEKTTQVIVEKEDKEEVKDNSSNKDITNKVLKYVLVILILILVFIVVVITTK